MTQLLAQARHRLERWIARQEFATGQVLPSKADLAARLGCSEATVDRALVDLARRGVVKRVRRKGTVVVGVDEHHKLGRVILLQAHDEHTNMLLVEPTYSALVQRGFAVDLVPLTADPSLAAQRCAELTRRPLPAEFVVVLGLPACYPNTEAHVVKGLQELTAVIERMPWRVRFDVAERVVSDGTHLVVVDQIHAVRLAIEHLLELGHRRIGVETGIKPDEDAWPARAAQVARHVIELAGGVMAPLYAADRSTPSALAQWHAHHRPTAVWTITDHSALLVGNLYRNLGLTIPGDVSLLGRNDTPWSQVNVPPLSSISLHPAQCAAGIAAALAHVAEHGTLPTAPITYVTPRLVVRASTGRAPTLIQCSGT